MARHLRHDPLRLLAALAAIAIIAAAGVFVHGRVGERYVETKSDGGGPGVTQIVSARLRGVGTLKVAELSGIVQATAADIRGWGWLRSDRIIKMPYSVDYFLDLSAIRASDMTWDRASQTLVVDAPDVSVARPNTDEGRRTLVRTTGVFVTRDAAEQLARRTSLRAEGAAESEARSPERMAQARELARRSVASVMTRPLVAAGFDKARVVVTFPPERPNRDASRWDTSRRIEDVLANAR